MNDDVIAQRVLPLAGLLQTLQEVRHLAENGQVDQARLATSIGSVLRIDADSVGEVYGGAAAVANGLRTLLGYLENRLGDPQLPRLALSVLQLERGFSQDPAVMRAVRDDIARLAGPAPHATTIHPDLLAGLGALYARHLSPLRPRIMVQGNPHYLGQPGVVAEIRAILLAAVRSAVLWRQLGGSYWDFLLSRKAMADAASDWLR